ncbi:Cytochrome C oxidase, cbb3-type, subunit III [Deinococcus reticulitermitis]|uniref:Cytochrome C oxidase, cbb3-type, subunit III n=1 Tax=Deinococcus reticulitermitis TaxID=856736 RepID=A0A1H6T5V1_9DEIO|nr:cytochrome c [Deinococcus reticulitermitis]SEI75483.1 Cytochrome C oxidase, cbb3-type, subunit III [Deinococcus reticulitermitis]
MKRLLLGWVALVLLSPALAVPSAATGKTLYTQNCAGCHGANAKGGVGPSLKSAATWTAAQFKTALTQGKTPKKTLSAVMPRFPKGLAGGKGKVDEQFQSVQLYLKKLKP